jgi:DNA-binding response OmpR family regulator
VVVLDVGLPGEDGYSVAAHLRKAGDMGIVMLTGRGSPADMARGLTLGVDLYLVKPLDLEVLAAGLLSLRRRLQAPAVAKSSVASRPSAGISWQLADDDWDLQAPNGRRLTLTESERAFLREIFSGSGSTIGREQLIAVLTDQPWNFDPHRLEVLVHRLRTRTRTATDATLPIRAVRGAGYRLAL